MHTVLAYVTDSDLRVARSLHGWLPPSWFRMWMIVATRLGDGWLWAITGLGLLAAGEPYRRVLLAAALAAALANATIVLVKPRLRRPRPCELRPQTAFGVAPPDMFAFDEFSFPSGHALNAFTVATLLSLQFPVLAPSLVLAAGSIAASRVVMGLHFLSDVLAGALIGIAVGSGVYCTLVR
jgi:undecaprenyl-diphosphatase